MSSDGFYLARKIVRLYRSPLLTEFQIAVCKKLVRIKEIMIVITLKTTILKMEIIIIIIIAITTPCTKS
jgi:hypothetical protein